MLKRIISFVTLICFISYLYSCSSIEVVQLNESNFEDIKDTDIVSAVTKDYNVYEFDQSGTKPKPEIRDSVLVGWAIGVQTIGEYKISKVTIPLSNIKTLSVEEVDVVKGSLLFIGGPIVAIFLIWAISTGFEFTLGPTTL